jgi:hypothetical protein
MSRKPRLRSLRNKLALVFFAIIAVAFSVIYFSVVTQPESNLEERRLRDLELLTDIYRSSLEPLVVGRVSDERREREVRRVAEQTDSQVTLFDWEEDPEGRQDDYVGLTFYPLFDSREQIDYPRNEALLLRALRTGKTQTAFDFFQGDDVGLVAQPLIRGGRPRGVALYSRDFEEVQETVSFIRERVLRDNVVIFEGQLESLRRFKEDVLEVRAGTECGIGVKDYKDVKVGDQIEVYERIRVEPTL